MTRLLLLLALLAPGTAFAADTVALSSAVFVEKTVAGQDGRLKTVLSEPKIVVPGDRLVFIVNYRNTGIAPASNFVVTNPMPGAVSFLGAPDTRALVSVDGGRNWGRLADIRVKDRDGTMRAARPEEVTHVRWALGGQLPPGAEGKLSFRGLVR